MRLVIAVEFVTNLCACVNIYHITLATPCIRVRIMHIVISFGTFLVNIRTRNTI